MDISMPTGACYRLPLGSAAAPGPVWSEQGDGRVALHAAAFGEAAFGGRPVYRARFRTLSNSIGIDLPVNHRMRMSASEP
ncbi:MAG TPA: hypothetical protein VFQ77_15885 [Pseudonocardiaceae bacterium]|jgi:hypothetical protein|nr:hypothetical protein [Pseudonocardiaceae bacterium]